MAKTNIIGVTHIGEGAIGRAGRVTEATLRQALANKDSLNTIIVPAVSKAITYEASRAFYPLDTENKASTGDIERITGARNNALAILCGTDPTRILTVKNDAAPDVDLPDTFFVFGDLELREGDAIALLYVEAHRRWYEVGRLDTHATYEDQDELRYARVNHGHPDLAAASIVLTAGLGLSGGGDLSANRSFAVNVDDSTIEINADTLRVKRDGITYAKIQNVVSDNVLLGNVSGAGSIVEELSGAQVSALIDHTLITNIGSIAHAAIDTRLAFFHGIFLETFDAVATSDGATVTMSLEKSGGGDLTMVFSDGHTVLDTTPAATIALTAGSDASPTENFIYILQSTKVLAKSTSAWPTAEHIKVGYFLVPSAGFVQADGCYVNQNWNDHVQDSGGLGHLNHLVEAIRARSAIYKSGVVLTMTIGGGATVDVAVTAGVVYQMHRHATSATDTATGDKVLVVNQNGAAYDDVTDLETLTNDSTGAAVAKYFNWVIWGVVNKTGEFQPLMLNLPTGSYNQQAAAEGDVSGYDVLAIPAAFNTDSTTGFLIARVTMSKIGGTWAHVSTVDLRGATPQTAVGGIGGVATEFPDNAFGIFDEGDSTKELVFQVSGVAPSTTRTITMPDRDVDLGTILAERHYTLLAAGTEVSF